MPKTAVNEDRDACMHERDVRLSWDPPRMKAIAHPFGKKGFSQRHFRLRMRAADGTHDSASNFGGEFVHGGPSSVAWGGKGKGSQESCTRGVCSGNRLRFSHGLWTTRTRRSCQAGILFYLVARGLAKASQPVLRRVNLRPPLVRPFLSRPFIQSLDAGAFSTGQMEFC
jgi:hypothetical protein